MKITQHFDHAQHEIVVTIRVSHRDLYRIEPKVRLELVMLNKVSSDLTDPKAQARLVHELAVVASYQNLAAEEKSDGN